MIRLARLAGSMRTQPTGPQHAMDRTEVDYQRRLEPAAGKVLHGAGQSDAAFGAYCRALDTPPVLYMTYCGLRGDVNGFFQTLTDHLAGYPDLHLIPQIGLSMTRDGSPAQHYEQDVAAGQYDQRIDDLCRGLKALGRPAFLRIGYEFNGHWNGYEPATYVAAWRRVAQAIRAAGLDEVARVWCYAPDDAERDFMDFYPGDAWVDWWAVDCFDAEHFTHPRTRAFLEEARGRQYPVMIGECTPRHVGVREGIRSWDAWFAPFFRFIEDHPHVKAFSYINWNWAEYEKWSDWGDGRIDRNDTVRQRYQAELKRDRYLHAGGERAVRTILRLPQTTPVAETSNP